MHLNLVLYQPEIPQNTGNIARTCAATGSTLHLIRPLGFEIDDKKLKRAGLDYWHLLDIIYYDDADDFFTRNAGARCFFLSTKADKTYTEVEYRDGDFLMFGPETRGLPEDLLLANHDACVRIPMVEGARSLNLSNSVAIVTFEALRQNGFENLKQAGDLF
ncbi:MAG: tRNA (uridine(34)/cytosine(34)/5-carboxymethylaminomethyluridine(34)-2'-O)-methyltransferase TrmL [Clostridia bacterium]|nr:tRNA (uridine(34)/cytosine(34)/5-carboxymethylaminomethyluridine(34)-2'-O)-methyltransferase TrmL [Clostridia bacterium]